MRIKFLALTVFALTLHAAASNPAITQIGQLSGTDVQSTSYFGSTTALSGDGKTLAIGT
jgi:hypothetical protein